MDVKPIWFSGQTAAVSEPAELPKDAPLEQRVIAAMRTVYDPEISVNIYDLGLIYDIQITEQAEVFVKMTLTAPGCPVAGILPDQVGCAIRAVEGVSDARVELVWDPPWSQDCMSDEAKLTLGLF
jgi:FeS assembly SUF system protein